MLDNITKARLSAALDTISTVVLDISSIILEIQPSCNDDNDKESIINAINACKSITSNVKTLNFVMHYYGTDHTKQRFFNFDENGEIHEVEEKDFVEAHDE